jgi:hypothetical protein
MGTIFRDHSTKSQKSQLKLKIIRKKSKMAKLKEMSNTLSIRQKCWIIMKLSLPLMKLMPWLSIFKVVLPSFRSRAALIRFSRDSKANLEDLPYYSSPSYLWCLNLPQSRIKMPLKKSFSYSQTWGFKLWKAKLRMKILKTNRPQIGRSFLQISSMKRIPCKQIYFHLLFLRQDQRQNLEQGILNYQSIIEES